MQENRPWKNIYFFVYPAFILMTKTQALNEKQNTTDESHHKIKEVQTHFSVFHFIIAPMFPVETGRQSHEKIFFGYIS